MEEELGISVPYTELFKYSCFDEVDKAIKVVFKATYDGPFTLQKEEVDSVHWMPIEKIKNLIETNPELFCKPFYEAMKIYLNKYASY